MQPATKLWLTAGVCAVVFLVIGLFIGLSLRRPPSGSPGVSASPADARDWSHKELVAHLRSRGLTFDTMTPWSGHAHEGRPALLFVPDANAQNGKLPYILPQVRYAGDLWKGSALVEKCRADQEARDEAGVLDRFGFSWGPFLFRGDPAFLESIQKALLPR
jgi:hypothetical protein